MKPTLALAFGLSATAQVHHQHHPPRSAEEYAKILEDPSRDAWQKPHEVIQALKIKPNEAIADIGAGSGYFTRRFARHAAKVYAVDTIAALKPGGRIVVIDFCKRELPVGPPVSMKLSEDQVRAELTAAGFRETASHTFLPHQYFLEFSR
jgi:predicted methyltransferase